MGENTQQVSQASPETVEEASGQLSLAVLHDLPECRETVAAVKEFVHTGRTTLRNVDRVQEIVDALVLHDGRITVAAKVCQASPNTIRAVRNVLVKAGKMDRFTGRIASKLEAVAEGTLDQVIENLDAGKPIQPNVAAMMFGVALDKLEKARDRIDLEGGEVDGQKGQAEDADGMASRYAERLRAFKAGSLVIDAEVVSDSESGGKPVNQAVSGDSVPDVTGNVTGSGDQGGAAAEPGKDFEPGGGGPRSKPEGGDA
jgi:hypothetical protein